MNTVLANAQNYKPSSRGKGQIRYLVIHYTSNKGDTAKNNVDYYSTAILQTSAHYFVDEAETWCSVPDQHIAWHCGRSDGKYVHPECRNANSIGIEICMWDRSGALRQGSIDRAAALARALMEQYDIPVSRVVRHYDVTGKICPAPMVNNPKLWEAFLAALTTTALPTPSAQETFAAQMDVWLSRNDPVYEELEDMPDFLRPETEALINCGVLRGTGAGLHINLSTLRAVIVAKRYVDAHLGKEGGSHGPL